MYRIGFQRWVAYLKGLLGRAIGMWGMVKHISVREEDVCG